jgi:hypothetical protein
MPAFVKGGEDALHCLHTGAEIADRQTDRSRRAVGLAGHTHDPAHALRGTLLRKAKARPLGHDNAALSNGFKIENI